MTTIEFGDADPEDAWDDGDPVAIRLILLGKIMVSIYEEALAGGVERATARKVLIRAAALRLFSEADVELST